jgi:hypothetical protein
MTWKKSSFSFANGNCVEIADGVQVRDSKDPNGPVLQFSTATWSKFIQEVK